MRYTILLHYPELMAQGELDEAALAEGMAAFNQYAADLDAALAWAKQAPSVEWGHVEVRPGMTHWRDGAWTAMP